MKTGKCEAMNVDASALVEDFHAGRKDPVEIMEKHLERIERLDPQLNAFSCRAADALKLAHKSRERYRLGRGIGLLDGVPIIVKDNLVSTGLPAAWGNVELSKRIPTEDEIPIAALRKAGAIILGKGNTPEFAVEGYTSNATFGTTRNPYDLSLTPGGSSGGVVSAVSSGMAVAGIATDGGGSIRRPAGYTGLWGMKPSIGTVQRGRGLPQLLLDFETVGPITRSARDLTLFMTLLAGKPIPVLRKPLKILAVPRIGTAPCDQDILSAFTVAVTRLEAIGHSVVEGVLPLDLKPLNEVWGKIAEIGLANLEATDPAIVKVAARKYRAMAERGRDVSAVKMYQVMSHIFDLRENVRGLWDYDAILMPTAAAQPWLAEDVFPDKINGEIVGPRGHAVYTGWVNAAGLPALAFPTNEPTALPIGMQLIGNFGAENTLLAIAEDLDRPKGVLS